MVMMAAFSTSDTSSGQRHAAQPVGGLPGAARPSPALRIEQVETVKMVPRPRPVPGPDQVLVEVAYSGVSLGTELTMAAGKMAPWGPMPFVAGYQAVGRVLEVGPTTGDAAGGATGPDGVAGWRPDDELIVGDLVACFAPGAHARHVVASRSFAHRLTVPVDAPEARAAALFVQGATAANALNEAGVHTGQTLLVTGLGLVGQSVGVLARLRGARVYGADIAPARLATAADHCVDVALDVSQRSAVDQLARLVPGGVDVVVESTGLTSVLDDAVGCMTSAGTFAFLGVYADGLRCDLEPLQAKQATAVFPWFIGDRGNQAGVLRLIESGSFPMTALVSDVVDWTDAERFYRTLFTPARDAHNGVVIDWTGAPA